MRKNILIILIISIFTVFSSASAEKFTLVIDAGHGGHDAGAIGSFSKEKDINLRTALAFGKYVERYCPDVNVIYTRKTDTFVTLHGRADIANKAKADLFISIHTNSAPSHPSSVKGLETYTLGMHRAADNLAVAKRENEVILQEKDYKTRYQGFDPNSSESYIIFEFMQDNNMQKSVELAKLVQKNVCAVADRPNKGVKQAGFLVLRETSMPSCLIELGFISTPADEQLLNNEVKVDDIARGIYLAFAAYKNKYDTNITVPYKAEDVKPMITHSVFKQEQQETKSSKSIDASPAEPKVQKSNAADTAKTTSASANSDDSNVPVFLIQIFASDTKLKSSDPRFKGHANEISYFKEGGMVKYTIGNSTNYKEIYQLRKDLLTDFPGCFIIAFKNNEKMDVRAAIREYRNNNR